MHVLRFLPFAVLPLLPLAPVSGALIAYWDQDASTVLGKLTPSGGSQDGAVKASFFSFSVAFEDEIEPDIGGTSGNIPPSFSSPTNRAVGFYRRGTAYADGQFRMEDFDFTGLTDVVLSFDYRGGEFFTWSDDLDVGYRIGTGAWQNLTVADSFQSGWEIASVALPTAVNGQSDVDLRIETITWGSVSNFLDIDNVQVNAVPEPTAYAIVLSLLALGRALSRRRPAKVAPGGFLRRE